MNIKNKLKKILSRPIFVLNLIQKPLKQDVLILINKGDRDTLGLFSTYCYLKYVRKIKVKAHSVLFMPNFWIKFYRPSVVVNILADNIFTRKTYELSGEMGCKRIMSPTETYVYDSSVESFFLGYYDFNTLTEKILLAGNKMKDMYIRNNRADENIIKVIGYPMLDWSKEIGRACFPSREYLSKKYNVPNDKRVILIATSFNMADINMDEWDTRYKHFNIAKEKASNIIEITKIIREKTVSYISRLLNENPDWHFVIKKHPFEKEDIYTNKFPDSSRVTRLHNVQFYDLLVMSDALIHWHSTTSLQAWGLNKPTFLLWFDEASEIGAKKSSNQSLGNYVCSSFEELEQSLKNSFLNCNTPVSQVKAREKYIKEWYYKIDGLSSERASSEIYKTFKEAGNKNIAYLMSPLDFIRGIKGIIKYLFFLNLMKLRDKTNISLPNNFSKEIANRYDNFYLELHKMHYEDKLKKYLKNNKNYEHV